MPDLSHVRVGTRGSALARAQSRLAMDALRSAYPDVTLSEHIIRTTGDEVTSRPLWAVAAEASGVFTSALEQALLEERIDVAVHSAKDLPTTLTPGTVLAAWLIRGSVEDALICREAHTLQTLPHGAVIGTGSPRRAAQVWAIRPDLRVQDIRGNVDTRLARLADPGGDFDAIVLALVGLQRLGRDDEATEVLALHVMLPAPAQGAIVLQCRDDKAWVALLAVISHPDTALAVTAERAFLQTLAAGCALPAAAYATVQDDHLTLRVRVCHPKGTRRLDDTAAVLLSDSRVPDAIRAGQLAAQRLLQQGAADFLATGSY